jgi:hypothetical protein
MRIVIGLSDGSRHESDYHSDKEVQEYLESVDGKIGTGAFGDIVCKTPRDFGKFMSDIITGTGDAKGFDISEISLVIHGVDRKFNPEHIMWHEIQYDDTPEPPF